MVIGANDIVNPAAAEDPTSPIAGMPVLEVWNAATTVVIKRGGGTGYSGAENPLFVRDNNYMYYGHPPPNEASGHRSVESPRRPQRSPAVASPRRPSPSGRLTAYSPRP